MAAVGVRPVATLGAERDVPAQLAGRDRDSTGVDKVPSRYRDETWDRSHRADVPLTRGLASKGVDIKSHGKCTWPDVVLIQDS
jgi:hypothetical protein